MPLTPGTRLGPYELAGSLGAGGMGEVYRARDTRLERSVAIKVLPADLAADPERRARFEREARTISTLNHPHICTLHDVGSTSTPHAAEPGLSYLVMEHLDGETLDVAQALGDLRSPPGNRLEALKGDQRGRYSIRVNDQFRVTFRWEGNHAYEVRCEDYHP